MNCPLFKNRSPLILVLILLVSSLCVYTANCEKAEEQEEVCSEEDQTCLAREFDQTVVDSAAPAYEDDDDDGTYGDYDDDDGYDNDGDYDDDDDDEYDAVESGENADIDHNDDFVDDGDDDNFEDDEPEDDCIDNHPQCLRWAKIGECDNNPAYMLQNCRLSCHVCETSGDTNAAGENGMVISGVPKESIEEFHHLEDQLRTLEKELAKKTEDLQKILNSLTNNPEMMKKIAAVAANKKRLAK